ncbi:MAG: hypothetical protein GY778_24160 [bacterium]|nr:hypothetical protein [bacterium]
MSTNALRLACGHCEGDLGALPLGSACTHCGADIGQTIDTRVVDFDTGLVNADLICAGCSYNLRTMPVRGQCPECFAPVLQSVWADELRFAPVNWLSSLRAGITLSIIAAIGLVVIPVASGPLVIGLGGMFGVLLIVALLALVVCAGVGVFAMTAAKPSLWHDSPDPVPPDRLRDASRLFLLGACAVVPLSICTGSPAAMAVGGFTGIGCLTGCLACTSACLRRLARRHRHDDLAGRTTALIWLLVTCGCSIVAGFGANAGFEQALWGPSVDAFQVMVFELLVGIAAMAGVVTFLGAWILGLIVLFQFRAVVARAIALAPPVHTENSIRANPGN